MFVTLVWRTASLIASAAGCLWFFETTWLTAVEVHDPKAVFHDKTTAAYIEQANDPERTKGFYSFRCLCKKFWKDFREGFHSYSIMNSVKSIVPFGHEEPAKDRWPGSTTPSSFW